MLRTLLAIILSIASLTATTLATGAVYKIVNPDGSVTYTDTPPAGHEKSEAINLPPINKQQAIKAPKPAKNTADESEFPGYQQLAITAPENNATIPPGQETVTVTASLSPPLQPEHRLQLYYDGNPYGNASSSLTSILKSPLYRGSHIVQFAVIGPEGEQLIRSQPLTIHIKRGSTKPAAQSQGSN